MPANFSESCTRFCRDNLCVILMAIIAAGFSVAGYVLHEGVNIDRMARETDIISRNTAEALDAHTRLERENHEKVMEAVGSVQQEIAGLKGRLDPARSVSFPGPVTLARPGHAQ